MMEMMINSKEVHIAANPDTLSAVPSEDNLDAAIHATINTANTKIYKLIASG